MRFCVAVLFGLRNRLRCVLHLARRADCRSTEAVGEADTGGGSHLGISAELWPRGKARLHGHDSLRSANRRVLFPFASPATRHVAFRRSNAISANRHAA